MTLLNIHGQQIRCDACCTIGIGNSETLVPKGWVTLTDRGALHMHVCGTDCLGEIIGAQVDDFRARTIRQDYQEGT